MFLSLNKFHLRYNLIFIFLCLSEGCLRSQKDILDLPPCDESNTNTFFSPTVYEVKDGDTLMLIAIKTGVSSLDSLRSANGLVSDKLTLGQQLIIPAVLNDQTNCISVGNDEERASGDTSGQTDGGGKVR